MKKKDKETELFFKLWKDENWDYVFFGDDIPDGNQKAVARIVFDATRKLNALEKRRK